MPCNFLDEETIGYTRFYCRGNEETEVGTHLAMRVLQEEDVVICVLGVISRSEEQEDGENGESQ